MMVDTHPVTNAQYADYLGKSQYCELQYKCQLFSIFSIENAERMENCPWKMMFLYLKWPFILQFEVPPEGQRQLAQAELRERAAQAWLGGEASDVRLSGRRPCVL